MIGLAVAIAAACEPADPSPRLEAAEAAFGQDVAAFFAVTDALISEAPCWPIPLTPAVVARVHRVEGLRKFVDKDVKHATSAFAAARAIEPDYRFPDTMIPPGHRVRALYATTVPPEGRGAWAAGRGTHWFDGVEGQVRPPARPTVAQWRDGENNASAYLWPEDPMFPYPVPHPAVPHPAVPHPAVPHPEAVAVAPPEPVAPLAPAPEAPARAKRQWIAPAATLAGAAIAYGGAAGAAASYRNGAHDDAALGRLRATTNGLTLASGLLAVTGVTLGVVAAF